MAGGKGYKGETCAEAIRSSIGSGEVLPFTELIRRVKPKGPWKDDTLWQHLMSRVVNLPPARYRWRSAKPFLFLRPDGRYELYNSDVHPQVQE